MFGLETFNPSERIFIDVETMSGKDDEEAFRPYHGHRMTTIIVGQHGKATKAFPIRNRNPSNLLLPMDIFLKEFKEFCREIKIYTNANPKFDMRFMAQDDVFMTHPELIVEDVQTIARLLKNDQSGFDLDTLCKQYGVQQKKGGILAPYLGPGRKDYGLIPVEILCKYGIGDVDSTMQLYDVLIKLLPEQCMDVWKTECELAPILFQLEHRGIPVDVEFLNKRHMRLLMDMIKLHGKISVCSEGHIENPKSPQQVAAFFQQQGVDPVVFNAPTDKMIKEGRKQGNASWSADALEQINHPIATLLIEYGEKAIQAGTFCEGWKREADKNSRIHPEFRANGTKTGRISSAHPNAYNPPKWLMEAITIPKGYVGVKWDKSQIEYRLFAHYSGDEDLLKKYEINPRVDYHQILADRLGIPRDPTKNLNFGMLYGMGKAKLIRSIAARFGEIDRSEKTKPADKMKIRNALRKYVAQSGMDPQGKIYIGDTGPIEPRAFEMAAEAILKEYHIMVPAVKKMQDKVKQTLKARGYIYNYFGRRYTYPVDLSYIGLNAIIQGSAADLFKRKLVALHRAAPKGVELIDMIYDSCLCICPMEVAQEYWDTSKRVVCDAPFKVPVLIDGEVAINNWGNITKIRDDDILGTAYSLCA